MTYNEQTKLPEWQLLLSKVFFDDDDEFSRKYLKYSLKQINTQNKLKFFLQSLLIIIKLQ